MLIIVVIAVGLAFIRDRAATQANAVAAIRRAGGAVMYDDQYALPTHPSPTRRWPPRWLVDRLGVDYFQTAVAVRVSAPQVGDAELLPLESLGDLRSLNIEADRVGDGGLARLGGLRRLERLIILNAPIDDEDLKHLEGLERLRLLVLQDTRVSDEGAERLRRALPGLEIAIDRTK